MMCDECGVRPANVHLTSFLNGEKKEMNLCMECMKQYRKRLPNIDFGDIAGLLTSFLSKAAQNGGDQGEIEYDLACSRCGMTYAEFKRTGMLGCSHCYRDFHEPIEALLNRIHGNTQHNGRVPGGVDSTIAMRLTLDKLKQRLVTAIAGEEYEQAASLRDQIRALNAQIEKQNPEKEAEK